MDPVFGPYFGPTFGCQNWALEFGLIRNIRRISSEPQKSTPQMEQNLDPKNRPQNWTPKLDPKNRPQKLDPENGPQNWTPELVPRDWTPKLDPRSGPQNLIPQLDIRIGTRPKIMALTSYLGARVGTTFWVNEQCKRSNIEKTIWLVGTITPSTELQACTKTCSKLPDSQQAPHETAGLAKKLKAGERLLLKTFYACFHSCSVDRMANTWEYIGQLN